MFMFLVHSEDFGLKKGVNNIFLNLFGILGLLETVIAQDKLFWAIWYFKKSVVFCFKTSPLEI